MSDKQTAHIDDWFVATTPTGHSCLIGQVSKHPKQADFKTKAQQTSNLIKFDPEAKTAETDNTLYTLGTPRKAY